MTVREWKELLTKYPDDFDVWFDTETTVFTSEKPSDVLCDKDKSEITICYTGWY